MADQKSYPDNWQIGRDYDPNQHLMNLKGRDYLNVQNRLLWFIRDQRALIVAGLAQMPYIVRTELVEMDRKEGWAHFRTYVRDVLGNEATMYGSESAKDFGDFAEKASTKSLGRALLGLGYGTAFAPEMDEGERVVDSPVEREGAKQQGPAPTPIRRTGLDDPWTEVRELAHQLVLSDVEREALFKRHKKNRDAILADLRARYEREAGMAAVETLPAEDSLVVPELAGAFGTRGV